jgi:hypothetical protein
MFRRTRALLRRITGSPDERRAHPRHNVNVATVCRALADGIDMPARIRNVSQSGVNLVVPRPAPEGTMIRIDVPGSPAGSQTALLACVMHVREISSNEWSLGCVFSLELSDAEIQLLGGRKTPAEPLDQRAWVRYPVQGIIEYQLLPGEGSISKMAELVNVSPSGVGLLVPQRIEAGTALTLLLRRQDGKPDRPMLACVVYVTDRPNGQWAIGCNFLRELSEAELRELIWRSP